MPTYEYRCTAGHQYEKRESFDAPAKQKCERCRRQAARLLSAPPIVFKGSGFYKTDSRGASSDADSGASSGDKPAPAAPVAEPGHGHAHGPGGHSHGDTTASPSSPPADSVGTAAAS